MARPVEQRPEAAERPEAARQVERPVEERGEERGQEAGSEREEPAPQGGSNLGDHVVTFAVDQKTREIIAKVVDSKSGKVLREFPSEQLRDMQNALKDANKQVFDRMA